MRTFECKRGRVSLFTLGASNLNQSLSWDMSICSHFGPELTAVVKSSQLLPDYRSLTNVSGVLLITLKTTRGLKDYSGMISYR